MKNGNTLVAALAGIAVGTLVGILIAPASGSDTRKKIKKGAVSAKDTLAYRLLQAEELVGNLRDKVAHKAGVGSAA